MTPGSHRVVLAAAVAAWSATAIASWVVGAPLGHDEAQYALAATARLHGGASAWHYLSIGMEVVAMPGVLLGGGELALRVVPVLGGIAFVLAVSRLARRQFDASTAAWSVVVLAGSLAFARRSAELLSDLPATACLVMATSVVIEQVGKADRAGWRLMLAAPWLAAAFYLRYGSLIAIAVIVGVGLIVGWPAVRRGIAPVLATAALFALLLVPHLVWSNDLTGSPFGIIRHSSDIISVYRPSVLGYLAVNPLVYYGIAATPAVVAGVVAIRGNRSVVMMWAFALAHVVLVGLTTLPQSRYVFFALALLIVLGTERIRWFLARFASRARFAIRVAVGVAALGAWIVTSIAAVSIAARRERTYEPTLTASALIHDDARGRACFVIGRHSTQLEWYSGCTTLRFVPLDDLGRVYVVYHPGQAHQPVLAELGGCHTPLLERADVRVLRLDPLPCRAN